MTRTRLNSSLLLAILGIVCLIQPPKANAQEMGHYLPGVMNTGDLFLPPPGIYLLQYTPYYSANKLNNSAGEKVTEFPVIATGDTVEVDINVDVISVTPYLLWMYPFTIKSGNVTGNFGMGLLAGASKTSVAGSLRNITENRPIDKSNVGMLDLLFQPLVMGWHFGNRGHLFTTYGFFAPMGENLQGLETNVGLGFFGHLFQLGGLVFLDKNYKTSLSILTSYEVNQTRQHEPIRVGDHFFLEYGIRRTLSERWDLAFTGYNLWKTESDFNANGTNPLITTTSAGQANAAGFEVGYWIVPQRCQILFRHLWEYKVNQRLSGTLSTLNGVFVLDTFHGD